ncbi:MAG: S-layer homology domain-containing protein [Candidatus Gracilibacteria bacterium]|jgi:hypothetical protein
MKIRFLALSVILFFAFPTISLAADVDSLADYDVEMNFSMSYSEDLSEGVSGSLRGTYIISVDTEDEVYWNATYTCGYELILSEEDPLENDDYEVIYEGGSECDRSLGSGDYLISQGESYNGGISLGGQDFIQDGAHYWYQFTLYTIDEVAAVVDFETVVGDFTIEFDELDEPFTDVNGHWAENYINALATDEVVLGYTDGTYKPDQQTSRAEVLVMALKAIADPSSENDTCAYDFDLEQDYTATYTDLDSSHWGFTYIEAATEAGVVSGYGDGSFRPDQTVTRAEALSILLETYFACGDYYDIDDWYDNYDRYSSDPVENDGEFWAAYLEQGYGVASEQNLALGFADVTEDWQRFYVHFADIHGVVNGYFEGVTLFLPNNPITRAELAKMAWKLRVNPHNPEPF